MKDESWARGYSTPGAYSFGSPAWHGQLDRNYSDRMQRETQAERARSQAERYAPKQAPEVYGPESVTDLNQYGPGSVTDLNQSNGWTARLCKLLCGMAFMFGVFYGVVNNYEEQQFNPFIPAYYLSESSFASIWKDDDSTTQKQEPHIFAKVFYNGPLFE